VRHGGMLEAGESGSRGRSWRPGPSSRVIQRVRTGGLMGQEAAAERAHPHRTCSDRFRVDSTQAEPVDVLLPRPRGWSYTTRRSGVVRVSAGVPGSLVGVQGQWVLDWAARGVSVRAGVVPVHVHESPPPRGRPTRGTPICSWPGLVHERWATVCPVGHRLAVVGAEAAVLEAGAVRSRMSCPLVDVLDRRLSVLGVASWE
jgi:hypothetical protein